MWFSRECPKETRRGDVQNVYRSDRIFFSRASPFILLPRATDIWRITWMHFVDRIYATFAITDFSIDIMKCYNYRFVLCKRQRTADRETHGTVYPMFIKNVHFFLLIFIEMFIAYIQLANHHRDCLLAWTYSSHNYTNTERPTLGGSLWEKCCVRDQWIWTRDALCKAFRSCCIDHDHQCIGTHIWVLRHSLCLLHCICILHTVFFYLSAQPARLRVTEYSKVVHLEVEQEQK